MVSEEIVNDMDLAREFLLKTYNSIVVVKHGNVICEKKGDGITPILETIEELGEDIHNSIIGDRLLGKASALLCRYSNVSGVYSPQGTKTAIALLIMGGIPCQIDEMIPHTSNRFGTDVCPFEKMLTDVISPEEAYKILTEKRLKG